jgi:hypothetical protein
MPSMKVIHIDDLYIDPTYQRTAIQSAVRKIADNFDLHLVGVLEVSKRQNPKGSGSYAIFDGQHRYLAALRRGAPAELRCNVHSDLTVETEADLWVKLNRQRKAPRPIEKFEAEVVAGHKKAISIKMLTENAGFNIGRGGGNNSPSTIEAVGSLERIYDRREGEAILTRTLTFIKEIWDGDDHINNGEFLRGVSSFVAAIGIERSLPASSIKRLSDVSPTIILRRAKSQSEYGEGASVRLVGAITKQLHKTSRIKPASKPHTSDVDA